MDAHLYFLFCLCFLAEFMLGTSFRWPSSFNNNIARRNFQLKSGENFRNDLRNVAIIGMTNDFFGFQDLF
jgi:hypothetical protein